MNITKLFSNVADHCKTITKECSDRMSSLNTASKVGSFAGGVTLGCSYFVTNHETSGAVEVMATGGLILGIGTVLRTVFKYNVQSFSSELIGVGMVASVSGLKIAQSIKPFMA